MKDETPNKTIAALDLGSNSFHLLIASVENNSLKVVHREKHRMRLLDSEKDYFISEEKIRESISLIVNLKKVCKKYFATIYAVATSAIRESRNRTEFVNRIEKETGISVKIISGDEEAELELISLKYSFMHLPKNYMLFDLGGGSTEFIFVKNDQVVSKYSLQIGAVRFAKMYGDGEGNIINKDDLYLKLSELLTGVKEVANSQEFDVIYCMGGTASAVANMIEVNINKRKLRFEQLKGCRISYKNLLKVGEIVADAVTIVEKKNILGLEETRADIILSGILIIKKMLAEMNIKEIIYSGSGLREGIIIKALQAK